VKTYLSLSIVTLVLVGSIAAYAHHPFSAEYDWTKPVTLTGTVTKLELTNPHSHLYIDARDDQGQMHQWTLEMGSPNALTRAGWTRDVVKMGDTVTVDAWLAKSKKDWANVKSVKLPDGRELSGGSSIADVNPKKPVSN
jgi:hypothetical protein